MAELENPIHSLMSIIQRRVGNWKTLNPVYKDPVHGTLFGVMLIAIIIHPIYTHTYIPVHVIN